jgi:DNA-binding GntR family transcriptional regulator
MRLECYAVELAVPQMSDRDIRRFENMLAEAVVALQRRDMKTYAMRDREYARMMSSHGWAFFD